MRPGAAEAVSALLVRSARVSRDRPRGFLRRSRDCGVGALSVAVVAGSATGVMSSVWQSMERGLLLDDLMMDQAALAAHIEVDLLANEETVNDAAAIERWSQRELSFAGTWRATIANAQRATVQDFSLLSMTCRKLGELTKTLVSLSAWTDGRDV